MMTISVYGRLHDRINKFDITNIDAICSDIDELVKQVIQSNSSRPPDVFYDFCLKLFDRVFGENATLCETQPGYNSGFSNAQIQRSAAQRSLVGIVRHGGTKDWVKSSPYLSLLQRYLEEFLGSKTESNHNSQITLKTMKNESLIKSHDLKYHSKMGELLICLACEYWMDTATIVRSHSEYAKYSKIKNQNRASLTDSINNQFHPCEVTTLDNSGSRWTHSMLQSSYLLVEYLLRDPSLFKQYESIRDLNHSSPSASTPQHKMVFHNISSPPTRSPSSLDNSTPHPALSCPPSVGMVQQPLFDMLRCIFGRGEVDSIVYGLAVELWLLYLQPWKQQATVSDATLFSKKWNYYVAANLHFYTTLLGSFFRATSRVDLNPLTAEGVLNFQSLERVLQCFSCNLLLSTIENLVFDFVTWYVPPSPGDEDLSAPPKPPSGVSPISELMAVKAQHHHLFPDRSVDNLEYFGIVDARKYSRNDGIVLATTLQKLKQEFKVKKRGILLNLRRTLSGGFLSDILNNIDVIYSTFDNLFNNMDVEENEKTEFSKRVTLSSERVCYILEISASAISASPLGVESSSPADQPEDEEGSSLRNEYDGKLTQLGRATLLRGEMVCHKEDIRSLRDPLDLPLCSFEQHALTKLMIRLSKYLNSKYGFPRDKLAAIRTFAQIIKIALKSKWSNLPRILTNSFRFNLRFLSQYRTFCSIIIYSSLYIWANTDSFVNLPFLFLVLLVSGYLFYRGSF